MGILRSEMRGLCLPYGATDLLLMAEAPHRQRWGLRELQPPCRLPSWPAPWQSIMIASSCSGGEATHSNEDVLFQYMCNKELPVRRRRERQRQRQLRLWGRWWPHLLDSAAAGAASTADGDCDGVVTVSCCSGRHCDGPAGLTAAVAPAATAVEVGSQSL